MNFNVRILLLTALIISVLLFTIHKLSNENDEVPLSSECLRPSSTVNLMDMLNKSDTSVQRPSCFNEVVHLLNRLYDVQVSSDHVSVPDNLEGTVRNSWLHSNQDLYQMFVNPRVLIVTNKFTSETSTFNPLRGMRKIAGNKSKGDGLEEILSAIEDARPSCDFCKADNTLPDPFGRIRWEKKDIFTAENAFRFYDFTGLVIPGAVHNFMDIDFQTLEAMVKYAAVVWLVNIHMLHPDRTHPFMVFDVMDKAGASQVHPHIQVMLGRGFYPGKWGHLDQASKRYQAASGRSYFTDLIDLHESLGLAFRYKSAAVIVPIDPVNNKEMWVIGANNLDHWIRLYFLAFRTMVDELHVYCFSQSMALPTSVVVPDSNDGGELMIVKIGARGDCASSYNDVSSLQLYAVNSISTDIYETMAAFRRTLEKYDIDTMV